MLNFLRGTFKGWQKKRFVTTAGFEDYFKEIIHINN